MLLSSSSSVLLLLVTFVPPRQCPAASACVKKCFVAAPFNRKHGRFWSSLNITSRQFFSRPPTVILSASSYGASVVVLELLIASLLFVERTLYPTVFFHPQACRSVSVLASGASPLRPRPPRAKGAHHVIALLFAAWKRSRVGVFLPYTLVLDE